MNRTYILLFAFLFGGHAWGQWVPLTAKVRERTTIVEAGKAVPFVQKEGSFYRRSDGSTLIEWTYVDGDERKAVGHLSMGNSSLGYQLHLGNRTAIEQHRAPSRAVSGLGDSSRLHRDPKAALRQDFIGAVACAVYPLFFQGGKGQPLVRTGEACWSHELGLMLKQDKTYVGSEDGRTYHTVYETFDIQPNTEPDPKLFDLQARGFTIYKSGSAPDRP